MALYRQGRLEEAVAACRSVIARHTHLPEPHHLLGLLLVKCGMHHDADESLQMAIRLNPEYPAAWNDLGNLCLEQNRLDEALAAYRRAVELRADYVDAWFNLGNALKRTGRHAEAAAAFREVLARDGGRISAHRELCAALRADGRIEETRQALRQWLQCEPGQPVATHLLASLGDGAAPERASDEYVQHIFDRFADTFEQSLTQLEYHGPDLVAAALSELLGAPQASLDILDAGCGTGLCGAILRPYARMLTGVDLSPQMLEVARRKMLFDLLETAELIDYLQRNERRWDMIVACDTFNYFGKLEPLLLAVGRALKTRGIALFTLERDAEAGPSREFRLNATGRYCHTTAAVERALAAADLKVQLLREATLRSEAGRPVPGFVVAAVCGCSD